MRRAGRALLLAAALGAAAGPLGAEPVKVRLPEGNTRGFLVLRPPGGPPIAHGELSQKPARDLVESRLVLTFKDGSLYDEAVTFSQRGVFRVEAYRLVQRGPSLPAADIAFDRGSRRYTATTQDAPGDEAKSASGVLDELPADLYNGMAGTLLKNLAPGASAAGHMLVFTPRPRLIKMLLTPEGEGAVRLGPHRRPLRRYLVKLEVGGLIGAVASLVGKDPPDVRYWLVTGEVPAFARFEGAMFLNGPVWRLEQTLLEWPG